MKKPWARVPLWSAVSLFTWMIAGGPANAIAPPTTIAALDSGWYNDLGNHEPDNINYIAGCSSCGGPVYRNFFVFDLSGLTETMASALFRINTAIVQTDGTYTLHNVTTDIPTLLAGGIGLTQIYDDLGDGDIYGDIGLLATQSNIYVEFPLNANAVAAINAASGLFAVGGTYDSPFTAFSGSGGLPIELILQPVPEPSSILLVVLTGVGLMARVRRRRAVSPKPGR